MTNSKKKRRFAVPDELHLSLPSHPSGHITRIVDTHTHILSTYLKYRSLYLSPKYSDIFSFVKGIYGPQKEGNPPNGWTEAIVDVWCEAPVTKTWKEIADSAINDVERKEKWGGIEYWFVMGVHPHEVESYTDDVEREILAAMQHPRCVGWGEIGLDYKVSSAPRELQQSILVRQLRHAVRLGKPITIHTREAEEDTERILKAEIPKDHPIHIHCFTDSPEFALRLIDHFPKLYIGITGVITYTSNLNTSNLIRALVTLPVRALPILLETDAPYMVPANIYRDLPGYPTGSKLPLSHTGMVPWTAEWVAKVAAESTEGWSVERVMHVARENARTVYGI